MESYFPNDITGLAIFITINAVVLGSNAVRRKGTKRLSSSHECDSMELC